MRVLIAAGGTGGHIYPAIAVADVLMRRQPGTAVLFVGTAKGLETRIVPENGYQLALINSEGLKNVGLARALRSLAVLPRSLREARMIIRDFDPNVVVGAGGYVSGPVLLTAHFMRKPTLVMDSNALPGFTNRQLARFVDKAALSFEEASRYFGGRAVVTGNPVRSDFFEIEARKPSDRINILIFGGSQGAQAINQAMVDAIPLLNDIKPELAITHQTGEAQLGFVSQAYKSAGWADADVRAYITDMVAAFDKADLIICRAGATTCSEVCAAGKPALMIPFPGAADDHQRKNAEALAAKGAARMILQSDLTPARLAEEIRSLARSPEELVKMGTAARDLARPDAAESVADLIYELNSGSKTEGNVPAR
jgi:UDP-N-acetylglucosamine--N-acetylmuramyl-(pentapeptide) pyrophosphoryl-undecaprenol N-acetylglucosamine transferase